MVERAWEQRALPILEAVAAREAEGRRPSFDEVVTDTSLDRGQCAREVLSLVEDGYITAIDAGSASGADWVSIRLAPRGRRAVGEWPADPVDAFIGAIEQAIARTDDPAERGRLEKLRGAVVDVTKGVVAGAIVTAADIAMR